jgi:hypothetical protein
MNAGDAFDDIVVGGGSSGGAEWMAGDADLRNP